MRDWMGHELQEEEEVYLTEDGLVKAEDISEYIGLVYSRFTVSEYLSLIKNLERSEK